MGKDKPEEFEAQYEREEGKTSPLLARLTKLIWHSGRVVILDSVVVAFVYYKLSSI
jgi:hypothetical protein